MPVEGGTFAFGDNIPFTVTVTDPEDGAINCAGVTVTFVLGHDTHGHAEATTTGCSGTLPTDPDDVSHGGNVFGVISASYTDGGGSGGVPALTTVDQNQIRQKRQEVENVINQSGTNTASSADVGGGLQRGGLSAGDWMELNGPFNLLNINSITFRVTGGTNGAASGTVEIWRDAINASGGGTLVATLDDHRDGRRHLCKPDVPARRHRAARTGCSSSFANAATTSSASTGSNSSEPGSPRPDVPTGRGGSSESRPGPDHSSRRIRTFRNQASSPWCWRTIAAGVGRHECRLGRELAGRDQGPHVRSTPVVRQHETAVEPMLHMTVIDHDPPGVERSDRLEIACRRSGRSARREPPPPFGDPDRRGGRRRRAPGTRGRWSTTAPRTR